MATLHTNKDGLVRYYGTRSTTDKAVARKINSLGATQHLIIDFDFNHLGLTVATYFDQDLTGDGTPDSPSTQQAFLPKGAVLTNAWVEVVTAFDSAGDAAALNIGTYQRDGTVIDSNGIDLAIAEVALDPAGSVVLCDGLQVSGPGSTGLVSVSETLDCYIGMDVDTEVFTAGAGRLTLEYISQRLA